jgi:hypothetical protein
MPISVMCMCVYSALHDDNNIVCALSDGGGALYDNSSKKSKGPVNEVARDSLLEDDHSAMRLERLFDFLRVLLGNGLLEDFGHRLDKLFRLHNKIQKKKIRNVNRTMGWEACLDEGEVWHDRLDLFDDLGLGASIKRFELDVENRLFFRFGSFFGPGLVGV